MITFDYTDTDYRLQNETAIVNWLEEIASNEAVELSALEYIFCSDAFLLDINMKYLNHDYFTDIITFPLSESPLEATIFISIDRVKENADIYKVTKDEELYRVIVHGLLHLVGYDDKTDHDITKMRNKENECLKAFTLS